MKAKTVMAAIKVDMSIFPLVHGAVKAMASVSLPIR